MVTKDFPSQRGTWIPIVLWVNSVQLEQTLPLKIENLPSSLYELCMNFVGMQIHPMTDT